MEKTKNQSTFHFKTRSEIPAADRWNLESFYPNLKTWEKDFSFIENNLKGLKKYQGKLKTAKTIADCLTFTSDLERIFEKVYVYAGLKSSENLGDSSSQSLKQRTLSLADKLCHAASYQKPELGKLTSETLKNLIKSPLLKLYKKDLQIILLKKKHILSDQEEALMSRLNSVFSGANNIYSALSDVDAKFEPVKSEDGQEIKLTQGNYISFLSSKSATVRKSAYQNTMGFFQSHINTYAETLALSTKQRSTYAKIKKYPSSLNAALSSNFIDTKVYTNLIESCHQSLPLLSKYYKYRQKSLGLKKINMWDLRVPLIELELPTYSYDQAVNLILEALQPLGQAYIEILGNGLRTGWVDKYESPGKRGGAFSWGCFDSQPYILMNFNGTLNSVYTLAHEAGHSMHSYLSRSTQPYQIAQYSLFAAEIASTVNERLLTDHLLKTTTGNLRKYIVSNEIDAIRSTFHRQTQFAEFEKIIHDAADQDIPLTLDFFNENFGRLNAQYHQGVKQDELIKMEWARMPHLYYNFYVYQYATGIAAAMYFSESILSSPSGLKSYLNFLSSGGNEFPLNQLKRAGIDFLNPSVYLPVAKNLEKCLNLL